LNVSLLPGKIGSFGKSVVTFCDPEKQLLSVIVRCAISKLAGIFCSFLPSPVKGRPRRRLYKERILEGFPRFFRRSHHSLPKFKTKKPLGGDGRSWYPP
jgi:hypothetical protein